MAEDNPEAKKEKPMTFARKLYDHLKSEHCLVHSLANWNHFRSKPTCDCFGQQAGTNFIWQAATFRWKVCSKLRFQYR